MPNYVTMSSGNAITASDIGSANVTAINAGTIGGNPIIIDSTVTLTANLTNSGYTIKILDGGTLTLGLSATISCNIEVEQGGFIDCNDKKTVILGELSAGKYDIFKNEHATRSSGNVVNYIRLGGLNTEIPVEWFGAVGDSIEDDVDPIQCALNCGVSVNSDPYDTNGKTIKCQSKRYLISDTLHVGDGGDTLDTLTFKGTTNNDWISGTVIYAPNITDRPAINVGSSRKSKLENFCVYGGNKVAGEYDKDIITFTALSTATALSTGAAIYDIYINGTSIATSSYINGSQIRYEYSGVDIFTAGGTITINSATATIGALRKGLSYDLADWIEDGYNYDRYTPCVGITVDAFAGAGPGGTSNYTDQTYNMSTSSLNKIKNVTVQYFPVGILIGGTNSRANKDLTTIEDSNISYCGVGLAIGADQARACISLNNNIGANWTSYDNRLFNYQKGAAIRAIGDQVGPSYFLCNTTAGTEGSFFSNIYTESIVSIGTIGTESSDSLASSIFRDSTISFDTAYSDYDFMAHVISFGCNKFDGCTFITKKKIFTTKGSRTLKFDSCYFTSFDQTSNTTYFLGRNGASGDMKLEISNCLFAPIGYDRGVQDTMNTHSNSFSSFSDRVNLSKYTQTYHHISGIYYKYTNLSGTAANGFNWSENFTDVTFNTDNMEFHSTANYTRFTPGQFVQWKTSSTLSHITDFYGPSLIVDSITATGKVTCNYLVNPNFIDQSWVGPNAGVCCSDFAVPSTTTGDVASGTNTITNVSDIGFFDIGDCIYTTGIGPDIVTDIDTATDTITLGAATATSTGAGRQLKNGILTAL
jgi:hypothetical protein